MPILLSSCDILRGKEYQKSYNFELILPDLGNFSGAEISQLCQSADFGEYSMTDIPSLRRAHEVFGYTGFFDKPPLIAEFLRTVPDVVSPYFQAWKNLIVTSTGEYKPKNNYAQSVYIYFYDKGGMITGSYTLKGVFPKTFPSFKPDYKGSNLIVYRITFNVDQIDIG